MDSSQFGGNIPLQRLARRKRMRGFDTYTAKGVISYKGPSAAVALTAFLVNLTIVAWFIYLLICVAGYVNAWPF